MIKIPALLPQGARQRLTCTRHHARVSSTRRPYTIGSKMYPRSEASIENHTMGTSLPRFLDLKVHQAVRERAYDGITVVGAYRRSYPSTVFQGEKRDKPFNWQRPTARAVSNHLYIECFPGYDYNALEATNIGNFPEGIDTVVLGLVHRLERLTGPVDWAGDECFAWTVRLFNGRRVAFLGFRPAFWGDISGELVHYLASRCGVREVLYLGKLGSVQRGVRPNAWLATGGLSYVRGQAVEWENVVRNSVAKRARACTVVGNHITLGSVLHETRSWLATLPSSVDFVDPEVGMMGQAAVKNGIRFGYLHIISDNVAEKYEEDLSNERMPSVLKGRSALYEVVQDVLGHHLSIPRP
ncbi:hypothetical protein V8C35DRAFT_325528 [Trichoderma chlorosporum]